MKRLALVVVGCAWARGLAIALLASSIAISCGDREATFTGLGFLPGKSDSVAHGVSADGKVVIGASYSSAGVPTNSVFIECRDQEAFRWSPSEGMVGLGRLPGCNFSLARAVSSNGEAIVGQSGLGLLSQQAFRWTATNGMVGLGRLPGSSNLCATAVSGDGSVVVGWTDYGKAGEAFRWTAADGMVGLGRLPGWTKSSGAVAISSDGSVVVGCSSSLTNLQAVLWMKSRGMTGLGCFDARAVSGDGKVVVGSSFRSAVRWTAATGLVELGQLPGTSSTHPRAVSSDGSVILGDSWSPIPMGNGRVVIEGFVWDEINGIQSLRAVLTNEFHLNLSDWREISATAISLDRKTIVGTGVHNGHYEAWIAHLDRPLNETGKAKGK